MVFQKDPKISSRNCKDLKGLGIGFTGLAGLSRYQDSFFIGSGFFFIGFRSCLFIGPGSYFFIGLGSVFHKMLVLSFIGFGAGFHWMLVRLSAGLSFIGFSWFHG